MSDDFFSGIFGSEPKTEEAQLLENAGYLFGFYKSLTAVGFTAPEAIQIVLGVLTASADAISRGKN